MKLSKFKKVSCIILIAIYLLSYFLESLNYVDFGHKAYALNTHESQLDYTNIVAILVDNNIYNSIDDDIQRYAQNYIQWKNQSGVVSSIAWTIQNYIFWWWNNSPKSNSRGVTEETDYNKYNSVSNSRAIVFPIDVNNITAPEITKILENLYFEWIEWESSHLVGVILVWDIPLPVVNEYWFIFPTIYPYVDFEDQKFIWDNKTQYFVYNNNKKWQAEIRHWRIKFDTIAEYNNYFQKLKDYSNNPNSFVWKNIWYDDFIGNRTFFYQPWVNAYINSFLFAEDLWYKRFSDLMISIMQWEQNESVAGVLERLWNALSWTNYSWNYASGMEAFLNSPELSTPTMTIKKILYEWYVKTYTSLLWVKYMDMITENIATANRWIEYYTWSDDNVKSRDSLDTHYIKIEQKDETLLRNNWWLDPLLISINNLLEDFVDDKVATEKYRLNEVIPLTYLHYVWAKNGRSTCTWRTYDAFENYFFWRQAKYITSMEQTSTYRWTYRNYQWISWLTINNIQTSNQPSTDLDIDLNKKSVWWSYEIFAQQVDANRWLNINNTITELNLYENNKTAARDQWSLQCEKKVLWICWKRRKRHPTTQSDGSFIPETPQEYAIRNRWWASPLNLDENMWWTNGYNFQDSITPIYDIWWSKAITNAEYEANSYQWVNKYTRLIQRKFVVQAKKHNGDIRKKFRFKNKAQLSPDFNWKGYNSSMWEDLLFTNYLPSFQNDDWDDIDQDDTWFNRVYTSPMLANSVNFFTKFNTNWMTKQVQWNIIKLAKRNGWECRWSWEVYTYKTLDSRVKNTATNSIDIGWRTYKAFLDEESPIYQVYEAILEKIDNLEDELTNSPVSSSASGWTSIISNLEDLYNTLNTSNNIINNIKNTSISTISWWSDAEISQHAQERQSAYNANTRAYITGTVWDIESDFQGVDDFFEYFSFEDISDYIKSMKIEFKVNNRNLIFLQSRKSNISSKFSSIHQNFTAQRNSLITRRNTARNKYQILENKLETSIFKDDDHVNSTRSSLQQLKNNINQQLWWCDSDSRYLALCTAIDTIRNNLDASGKDVADRIKWKADLIFPNNRRNWIEVFYITKYKRSGKETWKKFEPFSDVWTSTEINDEYSYAVQLLNQIQTTNNTWYEIQIEWMNITTSDRPIDSPKYMTFKWIGGDKVTFIYPDLYKVEVYTWSNETLTLLSPDEIANNIRTYLRDVVKKYNSYLTWQQAKAPNYYNQNKNAYDLLDDLDKLASPNYVEDYYRPYNLFDEDYLIDLLVDKMNHNAFFSWQMWWFEPIEFLAHMIYYQNIEWPERIVWESIQDDMDKIRESFDINQKISHIFDNYIVSDHNSGAFITPWYRDDWYEVAYINSDWNDFIVYETELPFMESIKSSASNYKKPTTSDVEKTQLEEELVNECNIPEDWDWVLLFDLKTMTSPWIDAIKCWRKKLKEKPLEFSISVSFWSSIAWVGRNWTQWWTVAEWWDRNTIWNDFSSIWESALSQLWIQNTSNDDVLNNANWQNYTILNQINTYANISTPKKSINADNPSSTIQLSSSVDFWNIYIHIINIGESKISISNNNTIISPNITQWTSAFSTWWLQINPYNWWTFNINIIDPVAGSNTIAFYMCPNINTNLNDCITKTLDIHVVPWQISQIEIETPGNTMILGSQLPIHIKWTDAYGNNVWQLFSEKFTVSTSMGTLIHQSVEKWSISFSNFDESTFIVNTQWLTVNPNQITISVSGPIWWTTSTKTKTINVVKGKLNISYLGTNIWSNTTTNTNNTNNVSNTNNRNQTSSTTHNSANNSIWNPNNSINNKLNNTNWKSNSQTSSVASISSTTNTTNNSRWMSNMNVTSTNWRSNWNNNWNATINITLPDEDNYSYVDNFNITQANTGTIPKLTLTLTDQNGNLLSSTNHVVSVSSQKSLVKIWSIYQKIINKNTESGTFQVAQHKFARNNSFTIQSGKVDIYLLPTFKAWNDTIYISMPWIDTIPINININSWSPKVVKINTQYDNIKIWSTVNWDMKVYDNWDNLVTNSVAIRLWNTWPLHISWMNSTSEVINIYWWSQDFVIESENKWWVWYIYAMIDSTGLAYQQAWYKKITIQDTILPSDKLNIMYLNLFGSDRWNQRWYFSDNDKYVQYLISHSEKLLTTTTQLVSPSQLKEFVLAIDDSLNVYNLNDNNISLNLSDGIQVGIDNIWNFTLSEQNFRLTTWINNTNNNFFVYIPQETDSIITSNIVAWNKIVINDNTVFDLSNVAQDSKLKIELSDEYLSGHQIWNMTYDWKYIWDLLLVSNTWFDMSINILDTNYDYSDVWLQWSTNKAWIWIYNMDSAFDTSTLGYKSIQDSIDPEAGIWFTAEFKNITNFWAGQPVWEATIPFSSEFLINIWDPLLKRISDNSTAKVLNTDWSVQEDTEFDKWLWELIYSDPTNTIFKVINIDFNNDDLEDIIVIYSDWTIKLLKNYWWTNPFRDLWALMILADRIKDVITWDVDWNGYEDIIIWTEWDVLRVYHNYDGIFEVDWYPICININVHAWEISQTPSRVNGLSQIFFEDMDNDGSMDIITNDKLWFIKIFYGWKNNSFNEDNYVSTNQYMCDTNRYQRLSNWTTVSTITASATNKGANAANISNSTVNTASSPKLNWNVAWDVTFSAINDADTVQVSESTPQNTNARLANYESNENIVYRFAAKVNSNIEVLDNSYMRRKWINPNENTGIDLSDLWIDDSVFAPQSTGGIDDKTKLSQIKSRFNIEWKLNQATNFDVSAAVNLYSQANRWQVVNFGVIPSYESGVIDENDIQYVTIWWLTGSDPVKVYKKYEDINWDVLEEGDKVEVTVTIQARWNMTWTFIDNIVWPWIIPLNEDLDIIDNFRFESWTITPYKVNNELKIHRDLDHARYMIDNIWMKTWDIIKIHYWLYYKWADIMNIALKDIDGNNYKQNGSYMTQYPTDGYLDIKTQPTDWCNPSMYAFFNEWSGYQRDYQIEYVNLWDLTASISASTQQNYDAAVSELNSTMINAVWDDGKTDTSSVPWMDSILESAITTNMFSESFSLDNLGSAISNMANLPSQIIDGLLWDITDKISSFINSSCWWFSLKSLLWINSCNTYIPFNESFLWAWDYHLFGCFDIQPLTQLIGKGMPLLNIPGNRWPTPYGYIPAPWLFGYPRKWATDSFSFWNDGWSYPSFFRLYVMPTLTAEIWFALCFGPYASTLALPDPMGSVWWNCVVFTVPIPCGKKDGNEEERDESLPPSTLAEYADLQKCNQTTNTPSYSANQWNTCLQLASSSNSSNNMTTVNQSSNTNTYNWPTFSNSSALGWFINIESEATAVAWYNSDQSPISITVDGVELIWWADEKNKILGSAAKWLIEKVVKSWLDKQIKYTMSNLTNFYIWITRPDFSVLTEWRDSLWDNLKSAVQDQYWNNEDKKACKSRWGTYSNWRCIEAKEQCENKWKQWKNWSCVAKTNKSANDEWLDSLSSLIDSKRVSREEIEQASESNFADPLAFLETAFDDVPLINITTEEINIKVPMITSDDITSYISTSQNWLERQKQILEEWKDLLFGILWICGGRKVDNLTDLKDAVNELKEQLKDEFNDTMNWVQNQINELEQRIKNATGQEKADLEAQKANLEWQMDEMKPYQDRLNALDTLNQKYDLTKIDGYLLRERNDWNFLLELKQYQIPGEIMPVDIYLLYNKSDWSLTPFTQWIEINTKKRNWKTVITSITTNWKKIQNWNLNLKEVVAGTENNRCVDLFIWGSFDAALDWFISIEANANDLITSVKQNIETLELYKKFPTKLYEWIHLTEDYLSEVSSFLNSFLWTLSMWMNTNATRYSQYINAIINIMTTIETYQAIIDLAANFNKKCSTCSNDNYDQFTCKLWLICPDGLLPALPIPPMKIPSIYLDFSNINVWTDIKLPKFNFTTISIDLPSLPDLPTPPSFSIDIDSFGEMWFETVSQILWDLWNFSVNVSLPSIPVIPSPPELQDPPQLKIDADISLPLLPPAPKIPALPNEISVVIDAAEVIWEILCLVKRLPLVNETSVKAKIEQLSQRTYEVPYRDTMDQTFSSRWDKITSSMSNWILKSFMPFLTATEFKDVELKWFDINVESYINLQINFDEFYDALDGIVEKINDFSQESVSIVNWISNEASSLMNNFAGDLQKCIDNPLAYPECFTALWIEWYDDLLSRYNNIKDRLEAMKSYIKNGFSNISAYKQELANLENEIAEFTSQVQDTNNLINEVEKEIATISAKIQATDSEMEKARLMWTLQIYNTKKEDLEKELSWLQEILSEKQAQLSKISNTYWPEIEKYDKAMESYNTIYEQYQAITNEVNTIKNSVVNAISQWWSMLSDGVNSAFDKLNEINNSMNSKSESFDTKQKNTREQRFQNLENLYKEVTPLSYAEDDTYDEETIENNKEILLAALNTIKEKTDNVSDTKTIDSYMKLLQSDTNVYPATDNIKSIQKQYTLVLNDFKDETDKIWDMIANDYDKFLYAISNNNTKLVSDTAKEITISDKLFTIDKNVKNILSDSENVYKMYLDYYNENLDGYINALDTHSATELDMDESVYQLNKQYLSNVKEKTNLAYAVLDWSSTNSSSPETLLAQNTNWNQSNNSSSSSSVVNLANYFDWQIISTPEWWFMLANAKFTQEFENQSIMTDINKDGKNDLILRDDHEIYIKYRDNNTSYANTDYYNKYYVYNISSYNNLVNNTNGCIANINNINVKLCDTNREVKNFKYAWSDFDTISISWTNSSKLWDEAAGYLVRLIHRIDLFGDDEELVNNSNRQLFDKKYIVVLPKWTDIENMKIRLDDWKVVDLSSDDIFDIQYFNESNAKINLTITDIPRNWQYSQMSTLTIDGWIYTTNSSTSNQVVWWPQIIADDIWPDVEIELYRPATDTIVDNWEVFDWYVSTKYTLKSYWSDNALLDSIWITDEDGVILAQKQNIFEKTWYIERGNIMFTQVWVHHYYFVWSDINGNTSSTEVTLTIKTPKINIIDIWKHITSKLGSGIPVSITAEIDQDLDEWTVQFLRKRNNIWELMTWVLWGVASSKYLLEPLQTIVTWAYFDFWDDLWLYLTNGNLAAKVNPANWKISIEPWYENTVSIEVDYANHTPIIKVLENKQDVLMLLQYTSDSLIDINVYENLMIKELDGTQFGAFNGWKAIIENNEILLYVSPKWDIYTDYYLYWNYKFDDSDESVIYTFKKTKYWKDLWTIKIKIKNILKE